MQLIHDQRLRRAVRTLRQRIVPQPPGMFPDQEKLPLPPKKLRAAVGAIGVFHDVPLVFLARMNMAGLRPDHDILEIGSGVGRIARYLCDYMDLSARYEGFDIVPKTVEWCQNNITPSYPNFRFRLMPLWNTLYNRDPTLPSAAEFQFPYDDESFDFVCANSVFTHLTQDATENYLRNIARVLRPGGVSCTTWFWFNPHGYANGFIRRMQLDPSGTHAVLNPNVPEEAIAYRQDLVGEMFTSAGLTMREPMHPGFERIQDLCIATKLK